MLGFQHALFPSMLAYTSPISQSPNASSRTSTPSVLNTSAPSDNAMPMAADLVCAASEGVRRSSTDAHQAMTVDNPILDPPNERPAEAPEESAAEPRTPRKTHSTFPLRYNERPRTTFSEFASSVRHQRYQERRMRILGSRRRALQKSISLSGRLTRVAITVQKGLYESMKYLDTLSFVAVYNAIQELRNQCDRTWTMDIQGSDPLLNEEGLSPSTDGQSLSFVQQLPKRFREDLLQLLQLLRTSPEVLVDRFRSLTPGQIVAFSAPTAIHGRNESVLGPSSRARSSSSYWSRNLDHLHLPKDQALAFERNNPLSALLNNLYGSPLPDFPHESQLRLAVWSSTCAELFSDSGKDFRAFIGDVVSTFASSQEWRAKQELELFLMERLQKGAALLERVWKNPMAPALHEPEYVDGMNTENAEEYFNASVQGLFEILDDFDGGLPRGALELGSAILGKLDRIDLQSQFRGFLFFQWYFCNFLPNALIHPESHGMLLEHHISSDAREKLLRGIYLRAQSQVSSYLNPISRVSADSTALDMHTESMISHLIETDAPIPLPLDPSKAEGINLLDPRSAFITLSAPDVISILDSLFPRHRPFIPSWDPSPAFGVSQLSAQSHLGRTVSAARHLDPAFHGPVPNWADLGRLQTDLSQDQGPVHLSHEHSTSHPMRNEWSRKADRVRRALLDHMEFHERTGLTHPCAEDWTVVTIGNTPSSLVRSNLSVDPVVGASAHGAVARQSETDGRRIVEEAARRLVRPFSESLDIGSLSIRSFDSSNNACSLEDLFNMELDRCQSQSDLVGEHYWLKALQNLRKFYPLSCLNGDDTKVLQPMMETSRTILHTSENTLLNLENEVSFLQESFEQLKGTLKSMTTNLEKLRNKMWYINDVKNSAVYESSNNVALALKNMALPVALLQQATTGSSVPRNFPRSLAGSLLQKPEVQTLNIMKASIEHGGPQKLADEQIEITRKWLNRNGIDNFCQGEERIHRFCFEIKTLVGRLVGDSMMDGRVLWSSDLYALEKGLFERHSARSFPSYSSARPSSIVSDEGSFSVGQSYHGQRGSDAISRLQMSDQPHTPTRKGSFQSVVSDRWRGVRDSHLNDASSIGDSPGKAVSTSTMESVSTFWSPFQTQAQSAASVSSNHSRPPSLFNEALHNKQLAETSPAKAAFLDSLRQSLTSLLLSDLGYPTWARDSETDAWFSEHMEEGRIRAGVDKLSRITRLLSRDHERDSPHAGRDSWHAPNLRHQRSISAGPVLGPRNASLRQRSQTRLRAEAENPGFSYATAFGQLVEKCSRHANPVLKLQALHDLRCLVIYSLENRTSDDSDEQWPEENAWRGGSAASGRMSAAPRWGKSSPTETEVVNALKKALFEARPKTLFRDLQFISAFVPLEILNKTESGTAFLQVGLAALSLKEDVCKIMVAIADKLVAQQVKQRERSEFEKGDGMMRVAARYWTIAAKEGYPVAQRELAILYLTHPELVARVTLPMTLSKDTFRAEMEYWRKDDAKKSDPQTMCLALHWMQLSANNGDELAKNRLREREECDSVS